MMFLLFLLLLVTGFGLAAAWIGANPGHISMVWQGYQIETSVPVLLCIILAASSACTFVYHFIQRIFLAPRRYAQRRDLKHIRAGLLEVTQSVAALAASDMESAAHHTRRAEKQLGKTPLTLLLRAQISKNNGSDDETRNLLEQLLEFRETEYLAAKSLAEVARKQNHLPQALALAERAHHAHPTQAQGAWAVLELHVQNQNFQEAEIHTVHAHKTGAFSRADIKIARRKIALKQAETLINTGHKEQALRDAKNTLHLIQQEWKTAPHASLANLYLLLISDEPPKAREKLIEKLKACNGAAAENVLLDQPERV